MNGLLLILSIVILIIVLISLYFYIYYMRYQTSPYTNPVLSVLYKYPSWYYLKDSNSQPVQYNFKIISVDPTQTSGIINVAYYDSLGGYISGYVIFQANFTINGQVMTIKADKLISTSTRRWPNGETWTVTIGIGEVILNRNGTNYPLKPV